MAIAEAHLAARYNRPGFEVIDHYTYAIVSDGDLMEGVASEAASLAGHLQLGKLICLYDDNHVTLAAGTDITFTEDRARRFEAYGWHTVSVADGNDLAAIDAALQAARAETRAAVADPGAHPHRLRLAAQAGQLRGARLAARRGGGALTKQNLGWPTEPPFLVPEAALAHFREALTRGARDEAAWNERIRGLRARRFPSWPTSCDAACAASCRAGWDADIPVFPADAKGMATRVASGKVMNAIAPRLPALIGGSADLDPSTYTALEGLRRFQSAGGRGTTIRRAPTAAAGATPAATCTSACASTRWARS